MMADFDNTQAMREGWCISDCGSYHDTLGNPRPYQLQRLDELEVFDGDQEAWAFVKQKANEGSEYHKSALNFLCAHAPHEYAQISNLGK